MNSLEHMKQQWEQFHKGKQNLKKMEHVPHFHYYSDVINRVQENIVHLCPGAEKLVYTYGCLIRLLEAAEHLTAVVK